MSKAEQMQDAAESALQRGIAVGEAANAERARPMLDASRRSLENAERAERAKDAKYEGYAKRYQNGPV